MPILDIVYLIWSTLGVLGIVTAVGLGAVWVFGPKFIEKKLASIVEKELDEHRHGLSLELEKYKNELTTRANADLERLKGDLQIASKVKEIQFSNLRSIQMGVFQEFYTQVEDSFQTAAAVSVIRVHTGTFMDKFTEARASLRKMDQYYRRNKILFNRALTDKIDAYIFNLNEFLDDRWTHVEISSSKGLDKETWSGLWAKLNAQGGVLKTAIWEEFQQLLGV